MSETTQTQASGSSFYTAMRLLPRPEREGMFAIYAFCRKVDDIADDPGPTTPSNAHPSAWAGR
jgi:phytoene/squalene synthetase